MRVSEAIGITDLRRYAIRRSLFAPTTLARAIEKLGFVQADPIRAPARAQDLILRHRVKNYRAGDLERRYADLGIEEDRFVNYGFLLRAYHVLMHPRIATPAWDRATKKRAEAVRAFVEERGEVHPRDVDSHFAHGRITNYWGGSSSASTQLLDRMHYRGWLRVSRRENGIRIYAPATTLTATDSSKRDRARALIDLILNIYAPMPVASLGKLVSFLKHSASHLTKEIKAELAEIRNEFPLARVDGIDWIWPEGDNVVRLGRGVSDDVRFLAPFDPIVWDRFRFELFWGWAYRFEAYTPAPKRSLGYYALPLLWRDEIIGWANLAVKNGTLVSKIGFTAGKAPRDRRFADGLEEEVERVRAFLLTR